MSNEKGNVRHGEIGESAQEFHDEALRKIYAKKLAKIKKNSGGESPEEVALNIEELRRSLGHYDDILKRTAEGDPNTKFNDGQTPPKAQYGEEVQMGFDAIGKETPPVGEVEEVEYEKLPPQSLETLMRFVKERWKFILTTTVLGAAVFLGVNKVQQMDREAREKDKENEAKPAEVIKKNK
ncbi:MAG: hypothetical protein EXS48_03265 [Candidatus Staskawiczbacteria bacterium]|nr:hypothetical protein [Candidatus Staskawiczbacteria bacterium]